GAVTPQLSIRKRGFRQGLLLHREVRVQIDLRRLDRLVTQPQGNHRSIDAGLQQLHGRAMAQDVRSHALAGKGGTRCSRRRQMFAQKVLDTVSTQSFAAGARKLSCPDAVAQRSLALTAVTPPRSAPAQASQSVRPPPASTAR